MTQSEKRRLFSKTFPVLLLFAIFAGMSVVGALLLFDGSTSQAAEVMEKMVSEAEEPKLPEPSAVLVGVGDNLIHEAIYRQAARRAGGKGYDFDYAYRNVKDIIQQADISSINQETVMAEGYGPSSYPYFNSPTQLGDYLAAMGFDVANLANNHCLDKGEEGLRSTLGYWNRKKEVVTTGVFQDRKESLTPQIVERNGIRFAFVGATEYTNGLSLKKGSSLFIVRTQEEAFLRQQIEQAKSAADIVVVNIHWGVEYSPKPSRGQKALAAKMVDWGADIILGHHPHVLQPVEYVERADGTKGIVAYSLGNFISAQDEGERMVSGALRVTVQKDLSTRAAGISSVEFLPLVTQYEKSFSNIRVYPISQYSDELAKSHGVRAGKTPEFSMDYVRRVVEQAIPAEFLETEGIPVG